MKEIRLLMGMPVTVEVVDASVTAHDIEKVYAYLTEIDQRFSTYKTTSEISSMNRGELLLEDASAEMREVFRLSEQTKQQTQGFFDILHHGHYDPSGLVKGLAIHRAALLLQQQGFKNFYVDAGGDVQVSGCNAEGGLWRIGIRNPFNRVEIVKTVELQNQGIATSGTYIRGDHIYNPNNAAASQDIVSLTVIAENVYEADRFATAAFAMGKEGIHFIESYPGLEGYLIDTNGIATYTSGFGKYCSE